MPTSANNSPRGKGNGDEEERPLTARDSTGDDAPTSSRARSGSEVHPRKDSKSKVDRDTEAGQTSQTQTKTPNTTSPMEKSASSGSSRRPPATKRTKSVMHLSSLKRVTSVKSDIEARRERRQTASSNLASQFRTQFNRRRPSDVHGAEKKDTEKKEKAESDAEVGGRPEVGDGQPVVKSSSMEGASPSFDRTESFATRSYSPGSSPRGDGAAAYTGLGMRSFSVKDHGQAKNALHLERVYGVDFSWCRMSGPSTTSLLSVVAHVSPTLRNSQQSDADWFFFSFVTSQSCI